MRRLALPAAAAAITALLLSGCTGNLATGSGGTPAEAPMLEAPEAGTAEEIAGDASSDDGQAQAEDRSVVTTGRISITVDDPIESAEEVADLSERAGGRVDHRTETPGSGVQQPSASLTLRIPADELDGVVAELRELGDVTSVSMNASDVTQQRQDLDARIAALSASADRLRELLAAATSIEDLIAIESELTTRQSELDSLTQQRDLLVDQVDFSTVTVDLVTEAVAPEPVPDDFWSGVVAGWNALVGFAAGLAVTIGLLLPWLGVLAVLAGIVIAIVVLATRSRRRTGESAPALPDREPEASRRDGPQA